MNDLNQSIAQINLGEVCATFGGVCGDIDCVVRAANKGYVDSFTMQIAYGDFRAMHPDMLRGKLPNYFLTQHQHLIP